MTPRTTALTANDLFTLPIVSDCALHPAKHSVAYTVSVADRAANKYNGSIRVVRLSDGVVREFTDGRHRDFAPQWSADGERLFFLSDRSGTLQLWSIEVSGGEPQALAPIHGNVAQFAISPDGIHIAAVATTDAINHTVEERGWRRITRIRYRADGIGYLDDVPRIWLVNLVEQSVRALTDGSGFCGAPAWSPDGGRLAFAGQHDPGNDKLWHTELWVAGRADSFRPKRTLQLEGALEAPAWSADGKRIAFVGLKSADGWAGLKNMRLFVAQADGSELQCWTSQAQWTAGNLVLTDTGTAGNIAAPIWLSPQSLAVLGSQHGCARVFAITAAGAERALTPQTHSLAEFQSAGEGMLVVVASDSATPPELYVSRESAALQPLTHETLAWCESIGLRRAERFTAAGVAGSIDAWHLRASGDERAHPAVLQIHGGPHFSYGDAFFFEMQLLAASGFDVIFCNPRGSQTYGEAFAGAIIGDWATPAFVDCMTVLDTALELYPIDTRRLGVAGGSYGGYLTAWAVGHSNRFAAAIAMRPATNLTSLWGTSEVGRMLNDELGGRPSEIPEVYQRCSPLTYADAITTPLLITQPENDYRCPPEQAEQLFTALRERGRTVEMLRFLNADHGMSRTGPPKARVARLEAIVEWLQRYLGGAATAAATIAQEARR